MNPIPYKPANSIPAPRLSRVWRLVGWLAITAVLALSFIGYLTPDMRVQWANFVALCGL